MRNALEVLHSHGFTKVKRVVDAPAGSGERLIVTAQDCARGIRREPERCPAAQAGQRQGRTLLVFHTRTYEVQESKATRWVNSHALRKAVLMEDKTGRFPPGLNYFLETPNRWVRLGARDIHKSRGAGTPQKKYKARKRNDLSVRKFE